MSVVDVTVPHAGPDSHTLIVAVEIPNGLLADPELHGQLMDRIGPLVADALAPCRDDRAAAAAVAAGLDVPPDRLFSGHKDRETSHARHELCRRLHDGHGWTLERIGRAIGRDHSTVSYGIRQARERLRCETCEQPSIGGGRWCHSCFTKQTLVRRRAEKLRLPVPA